MAKVSLMNFGDASRVFYNARRRQFQIAVGEIVDQDIDESTEKRIKRDKTIVLIPDGATIHQDSPQLNLVLSTLRDFNQRSYDDLLTVVERVMGAGAMGVRPTRAEMRMEFARRAGLAAFHIQKGATEEANSSLKGPVQRKVEQAPGPQVSPLEQTSLGLVIKGDEEDEDSNSQENSDGEESESEETDGEVSGTDEGSNQRSGESQEAGNGSGPDEKGQGSDGTGNVEGRTATKSGGVLTKSQRRRGGTATGRNVPE